MMFELIHEGIALFNGVLDRLTSGDGTSADCLLSKGLSEDLESIGSCTLRCALVLKNQRLNRKPQVHGITNGWIETTNEESLFKTNLLEKIISLGFATNSYLRQWSITTITNLTCIDLYWIPYAVTVILSCLQSSQTYVVLSAIQKGIRPILRYHFRKIVSLENFYSLNNQSTFNTLVDGGIIALRQSIETIWQWIDEISQLVSGYELLKAKQPRTYDKPLIPPRVGFLVGGAPNVRLDVYRVALASLCDLVKALGEAIDIHLNSQMIDIRSETSQMSFHLNRVLDLLGILVIRPVLPKSPVPFMLALESNISILLPYQTRFHYLPVILPVLSTVATSHLTFCHHLHSQSDQLSQSVHHPSQSDQLSQPVHHPSQSDQLSQPVYHPSQSDQLSQPVHHPSSHLSVLLQSLLSKSFPFHSPRLICCGRHASQLRHFITLQLLRLLHNSTEDLPLQSILVELLSYSMYQTNQSRQVTHSLDIPTQSLGELRALASQYSQLGWFDRSAVSKTFELEKLPHGIGTLPNDQLVLRPDGCGRFHMEKPQELDAMSWITSIHSHKEIIELIFHNFDTTQLPQSLEDVRVNSWGKLNHFEDPMLKLFVHQLFNLKKNMDETSMLHQLHGVSVVTRPSSSKNIEGVEIEEQDRDLKQQEREIRERLCVSIESEYEKIPDEICSGFLDKIQPRKKRKTEEERTVGLTVTPTSLATLCKTSPVLQLVLLSQIFNSRLSQSTKIKSLKPHDPFYHSQLESQYLQEIKNQILSKLLFNFHPPNSSLQRDVFRAILTQIWSTSDVEKSKLPGIWNDQIEKTLGLLFSSFSLSLRNAIRRKLHSAKDGTWDRYALHNCNVHFGPLGLGGVIPYTEPLDESTPKIPMQHDPREPIEGNNNGDFNEDFNEEKQYLYEETSEWKNHQKSLSYNDCYDLCLQYANDIGLPIPTKSSSDLSGRPSRLSRHKSFARIMIRFYSDAPYIPHSAFQWMYNWLKGSGPPLSCGLPVERKLGLAALSCLLRSSCIGNEAKRTAYSILLHLCFDVDATLRQEVLGFVLRKVLRNLSSVGDISFKVDSTDRVEIHSTDWDNHAAVSTWIESCSAFVLRSLIQEVDPLYQLNYKEEHPVVVSLLDQILQRRKLIFSRILGLSISDYVHLKVLSSGLLACVCASQRPALLSILVDVFQTIRSIKNEDKCELVSLLNTHLQSLYFDSLQLLPPTSIPDLLPILHLCNPLGIPVARALLERLVSFARTPESKSFISVIVAEGISASRRLKTLELIVPLLSCFPRSEIVNTYFLLLINSGDKKLLSEAFKSLRTIHNVVDTVSSTGNFTSKSTTVVDNVWSGESILSLLFTIGQQATHVALTDVSDSESPILPKQIRFKRVVEALDVCFDLAKSDSLIFPPDVFASFLTQTTDDFVSCDTRSTTDGPKRLPRLFGRLVLLITVNLTSLTSFLVSNLLPTLFRHSVEIESSAAESSTLWDDPITWKGISNCYVRLWTSADPQSKLSLQSLLCELPRHVFDLLFLELQRGCQSSRSDLTAYVLNSLSGDAMSKHPIPNHVLAVLDTIQVARKSVSLQLPSEHTPRTILSRLTEQEISNPFNLVFGDDSHGVPSLEAPPSEAPKSDSQFTQLIHRPLMCKKKAIATTPYIAARQKHRLLKRWNHLKFVFALEDVDYEALISAKRGTIPFKSSHISDKIRFTSFKDDDPKIVKALENPKGYFRPEQ